MSAIFQDPLDSLEEATKNPFDLGEVDLLVVDEKGDEEGCGWNGHCRNADVGNGEFWK